jgi:hypothetical protein
VARSGRGVLAARRGPNLDNHKIYKDMPKHEALVLMQARTECVGMAEFLFRRHVPDVPSPLYSCGRAPETPEHVLLYCLETEENRQDTRRRVAPIALRTRRNLAQLSTKHPKPITEWLLRTGKFPLYNKAQRLQREWETAKLESVDQAAATGVGYKLRAQNSPSLQV